jgi:hypothetical protein
MSVEIRQTPIGGRLDDFLGVVDYIYRDDPNYVRPLDMDLRQRLGKSNPFFDHAEGAVFTAYRNGWCVGRCTAQIDREHLGRYHDDAGFFGFFDTTHDEEVARELLGAAGAWLKDRGMKRMRGPMSLSTNEEIGCLIEGFDTPPMVLMSHHRPYQGALIEAGGLSKVKDVFAWRYTVGEVPARARKAHDEIAALPEVVSRPVNKRDLDRDTRLVMDVFNDAWAENWGFVPMTEGELKKLAADLKLLIMPEITCITHIDGEPAAIALAIPNLNELIRDCRGKLFPAGWAKLLWRLKVQGPQTARLGLLGIKRKFRAQRKYAGLSVYMYARMNDAGARIGIKWGELSWTLEDNASVNVGIKFMGGKLYKKYRIYEREL